MRALILTRVSTKKVEQELSPEEQERRCLAYCESKGWIVVEVISEKISGRVEIEDRALNAILKRKDFDVLIVVDLTRVARSARIIYVVADSLKKCGKYLVTLEPPIDTSSPMSEILFAVFAMYAQVESVMMTMRTTRGHTGKRERGFVHMPTLPRGFRIVETRPDGTRVIEPEDSPRLVGYNQKWRFANARKRWEASRPWVLPRRKAAVK